MPRALMHLLLLMLVALSAEAAEPSGPRTGENLDDITEFNRAWWHWRRCISKHEQVHGPSQDGKPPDICGPEPKRIKGQGG